MTVVDEGPFVCVRARPDSSGVEFYHQSVNLYDGA